MPHGQKKSVITIQAAQTTEGIQELQRCCNNMYGKDCTHQVGETRHADGIPKLLWFGKVGRHTILVTEPAKIKVTIASNLQNSIIYHK